MHFRNHLGDSFGGISKRSAEFPQACYGVFFGCPHEVKEEEVAYFREAFLANAENQDSCQRCQVNLLNIVEKRYVLL